MPDASVSGDAIVGYPGMLKVAWNCYILPKIGEA